MVVANCLLSQTQSRGNLLGATQVQIENTNACVEGILKIDSIFFRLVYGSQKK